MSRPQLLTRPSSRLTVDKTIVLVTNGDQGTGYEVVKALATSQPNFQVLLGCRDTSQGEAAVASMGAPVNVNPIHLDSQDDQSVDLCRKTVEQIFGRLDILINHAGLAKPQDQEVSQSGRQVWSQAFDTNVVSTGVLTQALVPLLERSKQPKIIFVSSRAGSISELESGKTSTLPTPWHSSSAAAVNMLAVYYSKAYPQFKVNAYDPGYQAKASNDAGSSEQVDPAHAAEIAVKLATETGASGSTGTFTSREGLIAW